VVHVARQEITDAGAEPRPPAPTSQLGQIATSQKGWPWAGSGACSANATLTADRQKQGLDGAMQTILAQQFGLLTAAALGFVAFGVFAILQSRYRRM
jgi:hypothetical protein